MQNVLRRSTTQALKEPTAYVVVLAVGYLCSLLTTQIWPAVDLLPGLAPSEVVVWVAVVAALVLWLRCREWSRSLVVRGVLALTLALWVLTMALELVRGPVPERASLSLGLALALMLAKPPGAEAATRIMTLLAWAICGIAAASIVLEALGLAWAWSTTADAFQLGQFERTSYWLPLSHFFGIDGRWAGPFLHPNKAGPVAAALLVFGLSRRGVSAWVFTVSGVVMLALTASRSSEIAALAGVVTFMAAPLVLRGHRPVRSSRVLAPLALAAVVVLILAPALVPTLLPTLPDSSGGSQQYVATALTGTGRTTIWPIYLDLWRGSPWTGVGATGISEAIAEKTLPSWAFHAHNTYLDALTRHGIFAFLLTIVIMAFALVVTVKATRRGVPVGLALVAVILVNGLGHTVMSFVFPEVPLWVLLLAVMMSVPAEGALDDG